jgi:hypothetical protein
VSWSVSSSIRLTSIKGLRLFASTCALLSGFSLAACSGGHNPDLNQPPVSGKQTVITGTSFEVLESANGETASTNKSFLLATEPLADTRSSAHFRFTVDLKAGGSATLFAFGEKTPTSISKSVEIRFERPLGAAGLAVSITASGTTDDWSAFFKDLDPAKPLNLGVDVHNDEAGEAHILIWNLENGDRPNLPTLIDSALDVNGSPGKGFGRRWGMSLVEAELQLARVTSPRYEH